MIAVVDGKKYHVFKEDGGYTIVTRKEEKSNSSFTRQKCRDGAILFYRSAALPEITSLYRIKFYVIYRTPHINETEWQVEEGAAIGLVPDIEQDEVGIAFSGGGCPPGWTVWDKTCYSKIVHLSDCERLKVVHVYDRKDGVSFCPPLEETEDVTPGVFRKTMVECRPENL